MKRRIILSAFLAIGMTLINCSSNDDGNEDTTAPTISIQSPDLNQTYSTDLGNGLGPNIAILTAQGVDETKISSMILTVTNSDGTVVYQETKNSNPDTTTTLSISDGFRTTNAGVYNVIFTATDTSGNVGTSNPRIFTYED